MKLSDYMKQNEQKKIKADIIKRWQERIVSAKLFEYGEAGTREYLSLYGKSIAAPKCLQFAQLALNEGHRDFAIGFYKKAADLQGVAIEEDHIDAVVGQAMAVNVAPSFGLEEELPQFPSNMQPGKFVPMQPIDGKMDRVDYANSDSYWGQCKHHGWKVIIFGTEERGWYQSRQMELVDCPNAELEADVMMMARTWGSFIAEGELCYLDVNFREFQTGSEAMESNRLLGREDVMPKVRYFMFNVLYGGHQVLKQYGWAVQLAYEMGYSGSYNVIQPVYVFKSTEEKNELI